MYVGIGMGVQVIGSYIINPRRACAARVTVLRLSVCLSVTTSLAHLAAKSLKFGRR